MQVKQPFIGDLREAQNKNVMVSAFFSEEDAEACATGYVHDVTSESVKLAHYTADGAPDGTTIIRLDRVFMVDIDGRYERKIAFLAEHYTDMQSNTGQPSRQAGPTVT